MEIFMQPIPHGLGQPGLYKQLKYHFNDVGIFAFNVRIHGGRHGSRRHAFVTIPNAELGLKLLTKHGDLPPGFQRNGVRHQPLFVSGIPLTIRLGRKEPKNDHLLQGLIQRQNEEFERREERKRQQIQVVKQADKLFAISQVDCGIWNPDPDGVTEFIPRWSSGERTGTLRFRPNNVALVLDARDGLNLGSSKKHTLLIHGYTINRIVTDKQEEVFFSLYESPRIYRHTPTKSDIILLSQNDLRERVPGVDDNHQLYSGFSLVYRVILTYPKDNSRLLSLGGKAGISPIEPHNIKTMEPRISFVQEFQTLFQELQNSHIYPFPVAYQLHALVSNGTLPPDSVSGILPTVQRHIQEAGTEIASLALKQFSKEISSHDPINEASDINSRESLIGFLDEKLYAFQAVATPEWRAKRAQQKEKEALVYRTIITPTGVYSFGPSFEPLNRVLRKYHDFQDHFMRVTFGEEDTESFQQERGVDSSSIIQLFKQRILSPVVVAGRQFQFLGFSSSSLKSTTCWFMADFFFCGKKMTPASLIKELGDFEHIKIPGRFAARVGQAFSDTTSSIQVNFDEEKNIKDIEREDCTGVKRNFSDGIGKVSLQMVQRIWAQSAEMSRDKPTVFQIRYAGAKGVIALDPYLPGDQLCLRDSMVKFTGSSDRNIEICNWAKKGTLCLNRPMIKVLEDRNVSDRTFISLQKIAVDKLVQSSRSPAHAANFFKRQNVSAPALKLPWVIDVLQNINIYFWNDPFLKQGLQLALATALRSIKYKGRIPVEQGVTLMGVLDETCTLREGQIYASYVTEEGEWVSVKGRVLITRSPQYHPGDVQMVEAVDVPPNTPLKMLKNCVAFSQMGDRPLPSMLSGGDLDGDLYNIIWDPRFDIGNNLPSAEYESKKATPLEHAVTLKDVGEFFIDFMQNNILGLIASRHLVISDQSCEGVHDKRCIKLAGMASTAVDFPKTGVKVELNELPKPDISAAKPDFLAPGPRAIVAKNDVFFALNALDVDPEEDNDDFGTPQVWYKSDKVLGKLYRAINEEKFLSQIKNNLSITDRSSREAILTEIWDYMMDHTRGYADWHDYIDEALQQRLEYCFNMEAIMIDRSETPWKSSLTEIEVFMGTILGKTAFARRNFEMTQKLRGDYNWLVSHTMGWMRGKDREETVSKAMAALFISLPDNGHDIENEMQSWAWVAICLLVAEVDQIQKESRRSKRSRMKENRN